MSECQKTRSLRGTVLVWLAGLVLLTVGLVSPTSAQGSKDDGTGESYWGHIPSHPDSSLGNFANNKRPLWEEVIYWPHQAVFLPLRLLRYASGGLIVFLDEYTVLRRLNQLVTLELLPFEAKLSFSAGGTDGFGIGMTGYDRSFLGERNRLKVGLQYSTNQASKVSVGVILNKDGRNALEFGGGYRSKPNTLFYGIGPQSPEQDRSFYTREASWGGVTLHRRMIFQDMSMQISSIFSTVGTRGPREEEEPALEERFDAAERPPGFSERSDGYEITIGITHDNASGNKNPQVVPVGTRVRALGGSADDAATARPEIGGLRKVGASYFRATDGSDVSFWTYRAELQQFLPLWFTRRSLATRALITRLDNTGDDEIPFQRLLTNDEPDLFRGYEDARWSDRGLLLFSGEYRWPVWNLRGLDDLGVDAYLFVDYAQVFGEFDEISLDNMTTSYGGGFRLVNTGGFVARLELAHSEEDTLVRLRGDQVFQFARNGLFHGRVPVPKR